MIGKNSILSVKEAAKELGVTDARIRQLCLDGTLNGAWKLSARAWLIPTVALRGVRTRKQRTDYNKKRRGLENGASTK